MQSAQYSLIISSLGVKSQTLRRVLAEIFLDSLALRDHASPSAASRRGLKIANRLALRRASLMVVPR